MFRNLCLLAMASSVFAGTIVQPSNYDDISNVGWTDGSTLGISFVGSDTATPANGTTFASFWVFNLPVGGAISSATFDLAPRAFFGDGSSVTVNFTAFALSPSLLGPAYASGSATGESIYNAINSGAPFGQLVVHPSDVMYNCQDPTCPAQPGDTLLLQLDSLAIADMNADLGGVFVIGAYLSPNSYSPTEDAIGVQFGFLGLPGPVAQLDLATAPEPGTGLLALAAIAGLMVRVRLRIGNPTHRWNL